MRLFSCFNPIVGRKKKQVKDAVVSSPGSESRVGQKTLQVKLEHTMKPSEHDELNSTSFSVPVPIDIPEISGCNVKLVNSDERPAEEDEEGAYEGEDEQDDRAPLSRDHSDPNLQAHDSGSSNLCLHVESPSADVEAESHEFEFGRCGHVSDPGMARKEQWDLPRLTRSCSTLDTREVLEKIASRLPASKAQSFEKLQELANEVSNDVFMGSPCSESSVLSHRSADKVMLKKHSSSQILPSRSKKLWWKLFLWSHRNLQKPVIPPKTRVSLIASVNQQGGYSSDTLEPCPPKAKQLSKVESAGSFSELCSYKSSHEEDSEFKGVSSGLWPQNQWIAFSGESSSPFKRIDDWVKDIEIQPTTSSFEEENDNEQNVFPSSPEANGRYPTQVSRQNKFSLSEELVHANDLIQSLNSSSTVAHISGMGMKTIPMISHFSSLRSVNLSNNSIVQITQGSLPKGLHVLDISRNKIATIEGLRELTRLRILDLSYNRISRIGHGLSSCTLLRDLYIAANKISEVEGLHRLLKLRVLDLSFNKITTTKALGQLVANYNSLVALNIVGNPVHSNLSNDQLRRAVTGLLPKLAYLNKQPVNQQKAREVSMDIIAKTSARNNNWNARRKSVKKAGQNPSGTSAGQRSRNKSKRQVNQQSRLKTRAING